MKTVENDQLTSEASARYIEKLCLEFSRLLYEVSCENDESFRALEQKCAALEEKCKHYEELLLSKKSGASASARAAIRSERLWAKLKRRVKALLAAPIKLVFRVGKAIATRMGIKDRLKETKLYRKLYMKGTIDRLRGER